MIFNLNKNIKDSFWYTFGELFSRFSGFLLLPFYTRVFSPEQYGLLSMIVLITALSNHLNSLASKTAYLRMVYDYDEEGKKRLTYIITTLVLLVTTISLIFVAIANIISNYYELSISIFFKYIYFIIGYSFFFSINNIALNILRVNRKVKLYSFFNIIKTTLELILIILFVNFLTDGVLGKILGSLITMIILTIVLFRVVIRNHISYSYNRNIAKKYLRFALPLVGNYLLGWTLVSYDQMIFGRNFGLKEFALLSLALQVCNIYKFSMEGVLHAFNVYLYEKINSIKNNYKEIFTLFISIFVIAAVFILLFSKEIIFLLSTKDYTSASEVINWYIFSRFIMLINALIVFILLAYKKSKQIAVSTIFAVSSMLIFSTLLIPQYGVKGAAVAATITFLIRNIYLSVTLHKMVSFVSYKSLFLFFSLILVVFINIHYRLNFIHKIIVISFLSSFIIFFNKSFFNKIFV